MYYPSSENKGADQLRDYREADLRLCFRIYAKSRFSHDAAHNIQLTFTTEKLSLGPDTNRPVQVHIYTTKISHTPFTQLLPTRVCFTNAGVNTYGAEIHKVRKHAIYAFPSFLFLILLFRLYVKEPFSEL